MPRISSWLTILSIAAVIFLLAAMPCIAQQQSSLGRIGNTTVTLYYYDSTNQTKGDVVPMPDNPQYVNVDPAYAAPGMYTFSHVPSGEWYYLEADHQGNKWYSIFYMEENVGTKTANVNIPPMRPVNITPANMPRVTPQDTVPAIPSPSPAATPVPAASPGMTLAAAIVAAALALAFISVKR